VSERSSTHRLTYPGRKRQQIYARKEGVECHSPRGCLKTAFQLGLLEYDEVFARLPRYAGLLARLVAGLSA
jgi:hypothetical protein